MSVYLDKDRMIEEDLFNCYNLNNSELTKVFFGTKQN